MNRSALGFWGIADQSLRLVGKGAAWVLTRRIKTEEEYDSYAMIGGAVVCAVFCGIVGFALSDRSRSIATIEAAVIGGLLGICVGIPFGAFVESVDGGIQDMLRSLKSK